MPRSQYKSRGRANNRNEESLGWKGSRLDGEAPEESLSQGGSTSAITGPVVSLFAVSRHYTYRGNNVETNSVEFSLGSTTARNQTRTKSVLARKVRGRKDVAGCDARQREREARQEIPRNLGLSPLAAALPRFCSSVITLMIAWPVTSVNRPLFRVSPRCCHCCCDNADSSDGYKPRST